MSCACFCVVCFSVSTAAVYPAVRLSVTNMPVDLCVYTFVYSYFLFTFLFVCLYIFNFHQYFYIYFLLLFLLLLLSSSVLSVRSSDRLPLLSQSLSL